MASWSTRFGGCVVVKDWKTGLRHYRGDHKPVEDWSKTPLGDWLREQAKQDQGPTPPPEDTTATATPASDLKWREKTNKGKPVGSLYNAKTALSPSA